MRIVMVHPNTYQHSPNHHPPLSIIFPGAFYEGEGHEVDYFDLRVDSEKDMFKSVASADRLCISTMSYQPMLTDAIRIFKKAKMLNPGIVNVIGGSHAKYSPDTCERAEYIDEVVKGHLGLEKSPFTEKTKKFFLQPYMPLWFSSVGCPFTCTFCSLEHNWMPRPMDKVLSEIKQILEWNKSRIIVLADPNIGRGERLVQIKDFMKENDFEYYTNIRNDMMDKETVKVLDEGNCTRLELGCESGSDRILKEIINKKHGVDIIKKSITNLSGTNISAMCSFMVGVPTETNKEIAMSMDLVDWIRKVAPKSRNSFYSYVPFPGVRMTKMAVEYQGFVEPTSLEGWANSSNKMSDHPLYWVAGLNFRKENTAQNFPGGLRKLISGFEVLANACWVNRVWDKFPVNEVSKLVELAASGKLKQHI